MMFVYRYTPSVYIVIINTIISEWDTVFLFLSELLL